jgi:hypothetical protein
MARSKLFDISHAPIACPTEADNVQRLRIDPIAGWREALETDGPGCLRGSAVVPFSEITIS